MPADPRLIPATAEDIEEALAFALRFDGRKRAHGGDELMARITAERLALLQKSPNAQGLGGTRPDLPRKVASPIFATEPR